VFFNNPTIFHLPKFTSISFYLYRLSQDQCLRDALFGHGYWALFSVVEMKFIVSCLILWHGITVRKCILVSFLSVFPLIVFLALLYQSSNEAKHINA
jgi:hypothetical protein